DVFDIGKHTARFLPPPDIGITAAGAVSPVIVGVSCWGFEPFRPHMFGCRDLSLYPVKHVADPVAVIQRYFIPEVSVVVQVFLWQACPHGTGNYRSTGCQ